MKTIVIRAVLTICTTLLFAAVCHAQGGGGGGGSGPDDRRDRAGWRDSREFDRELRLRAQEARRKATERRREQLRRRQEQREEFLEQQQRERDQLQGERDHGERYPYDNDDYGKEWSDIYDRGRFDDPDRHHDHHRRHGDGGHPLDVQRLNAERELQHRLNQAEHLRQISERNGNSRLAQAAQRKEQRALEHYDKRLESIDQHQTAVRQTRDGHAEQTLSSNWRSDRVQSSLTAQPRSSSLSEFSDEFQSRLLSEQRELRHRLDVADRMRRLGEFNGDQQLLESADRIEDAAFERFDRRIQGLGEPLTPVQQSQLDDFFDRAVTSMLEREQDRTVRQSLKDLEKAVLDQPMRHLLEDVGRLLSR